LELSRVTKGVLVQEGGLFDISGVRQNHPDRYPPPARLARLPPVIQLYGSVVAGVMMLGCGHTLCHNCLLSMAKAATRRLRGPLDTISDTISANVVLLFFEVLPIDYNCFKPKYCARSVFFQVEG